MASSSMFRRVLNLSLILSWLVFAMNCRGSVAAAGFTNETDRQALLAFKDLIQEDPLAVLSSWNDSLHFCEWNGVTCGRQRKKVTALELVSQNLVGSVSPQIGRLTFLRKIHLNNNSFHGTIPPEIGQLWRRYRGVNFEGQWDPRWPSDLGDVGGEDWDADLGLTLPNLKYLYLGGNKFSGSFPPSMANASGLLLLSMSRNDFTGPIPKNLGNLRDLKYLQLNGNRFVSNKPDDLSFVGSLTNCTNLRKLMLSKNQFGGVLPGSIANMSSKLEILSLGSNKISGSIPQEIGNLNNLYLLEIDDNMISGSIPESIGKLSKLQQMRIVTNNISGKIPSSIGNITGLSYLAAAANKLEGRIPAELGNCTNLQALYLGSNRLTGVIPEQVIGISSLTIGLYLDLNEFTGSLPSQVGKLKNLGALSISGNKLTGEIPSALGDCQVLEYLDLHGNFLDGAIPSSLDHLKGIQQLDLSQNNLSGQIPEFLGKLPLMRLNLSHNMFEGEVPKVGVFNNISASSVVGKSMKLCGGIQPLHLPACPIKFSKKNKRAFPDKMIPLIIILPIVLLFACLFLIFYRLKKSQQRTSSASLLENRHPEITYAELLHATNGFSPSNLIGEGRYGSVYKGSLNSGEHIVAVKVLKLQERGANKSFMAECDVLRILRHRNLIKIMTACSSLDFKGKDFKALVFEFMPNGSLDSWLHPTQAEKQGSNLNLVQRLGIAIDVAFALEYIHHHCETTICHCDLKPSNILLDDDLCAHVEYGMGEEVSTEADMYSYGIMLLEMFTGKRPTDNMFIDNFSLHNYAKFAFPDRVMEIVDSTIILEEMEGLDKNRRGEGDFAKLKSCLESILRLGVVCSAELPHERMDSGNVVNELQRITKAYNEERERERERERNTLHLYYTTKELLY
ncbi:hypothetical protein RJ640_026826 [Escallonia rubra]|uniref:non-specific serine/threonine protein kinase n=1 Tax=Escallonia rubra TaxID=112253 RepID=A0AA88S098_9ASTE|nr:hypothetical protein RJ640_026826 [Escallonia rubra]